MGWMVIIGHRLSSVPIYYEATIRMLVIEGLKFQLMNHRQKLTIRKTFETISIS